MSEQQSERKRQAAITKVYDKLHEGKLGAHWLWCVIEQVASGHSEEDAMREFGYYSRAALSKPSTEQGWTHEINQELERQYLKGFQAGKAFAVSEQGWRTIESAPKGSGQDGPSQVTHPDYVQPPKILLATSGGIVVGYYEWYYHPGYGIGADPSESIWRDHDGGRLYDVTHWMPLPTPPI